MPKFKKYSTIAKLETRNVRSQQHVVRVFIKQMAKRQQLLDNIKNLSANYISQGKQLFEDQKMNNQKNVVKTKNNLYMIKKNLYWNYYYLNITNTKLNVEFSHIKAIKSNANRRRKYSQHHLGIAKLAVMDVKVALHYKQKKLRYQKQRLYKKILSIRIY